jgi:two-component system chemotaxis response regulator CheB
MDLRVLVVDDTIVFRRAVSDALAGLPGMEVVGTASNGKLALARMKDLRPDLLTLDIEMPEMNGLEVLEAMNAEGSSAGAIVLSSLTTRGGQMTVRALELGAFDFLTKPSGTGSGDNVAELRTQLIPTIQAFRRHREIRSILKPRGGSPATPAGQPCIGAPPRRDPPALRTGRPIVLIGVSTGGPVALSRVLPHLPKDLGAPILIVQHMPALFTASLAASLAAKCTIGVREAKDGEPAEPGCAYIAPGGFQMKVEAGQNREVILRVTDDAPENNCRPAVDTLFRSAALQFPGRAVAAILTGMGTDGTAGLRQLKRGGCYAIAQDEMTSVVFGMPKEAIATGLVDSVEPLDRIASAIIRAVRGAGR